MINKQVIGKRIHQVRLENSLTQDEFAQILEVKRSAISQIENGVIAPSLELLNKICTNFNISIDWIINGISGDFLKHSAILAGYAEKLNQKSVSSMLPTNDETIQFLKNIIVQKEIEQGKSIQIMKYLEEKKQVNEQELETLKKLLSVMEDELEKKKKK